MTERELLEDAWKNLRARGKVPASAVPPESSEVLHPLVREAAMGWTQQSPLVRESNECLVQIGFEPGWLPLRCADPPPNFMLCAIRAIPGETNRMEWANFVGVDAAHRAARADLPYGEPCPRHPVGPLVEAWGKWPRAVSSVEPYRPVNRANLPHFHRIAEAEARTLPMLHAAGDAPEQPLLPGFKGPAPASWLVAAYDLCDAAPAQGRGAPWDLRLFVYSVLHLAVADGDGEFRSVRVPHLHDHAKRIEDASGQRVASVAEWLHGDRWTNRRRDWHRLPEALRRFNQRLGWIQVPGFGHVRIATASVIPSSQADPLVEFTVRVPPSAASGDRIDWPTLTRYGRESSPLFRTYLSAAAMMGAAAHRGHAITREILPPVLDGEGKPKRRKGGR